MHRLRSSMHCLRSSMHCLRSSITDDQSSIESSVFSCTDDQLHYALLLLFALLYLASCVPKSIISHMCHSQKCYFILAFPPLIRSNLLRGSWLRIDSIAYCNRVDIHPCYRAYLMHSFPSFDSVQILPSRKRNSAASVCYSSSYFHIGL